MNKLLSIVVIGVVVVAGGYWLWSSQLSSSEPPYQETQEITTDQAQDLDTAVLDESEEDALSSVSGSEFSETSPSSQTDTASYQDYSPQALAQASQNGTAVLFFHANWCPTCKAADKDITANLDQLPAGVTILKTDYDSERELKRKYGVTSQHTFVQVAADGSATTLWLGGDVDEINKRIKI